MPYDGSGNFTRLMNWQDDAEVSIKIRADRHDVEDNNFANGLSNVICKDGQTQINNNLSMNGHKWTNLAEPTNAQDATTKAYVDAKVTTATTGAEILAKLVTVDGTGSNLDADKLDGKDSTEFQAAGNYVTTDTVQTIAQAAHKTWINDGNIGQTGNTGLLMQSNVNNGDACISFHSPGAFAAHIGLRADGGFYEGGWSLGAIAYRFWTARNMPVGDWTNIRDNDATAYRAWRGTDIYSAIYNQGMTWWPNWSAAQSVYSGLGSYGLMASDVANQGVGTAIGGGNLWYASAGGVSGAQPAGTWRLLGVLGPNPGPQKVSLFVRYA